MSISTRVVIAPQGNRGRRYSSDAGESYQMDWGFVNVDTGDGTSYKVACFAMIRHHYGERYIAFFPNAKQENLFIGMIHAFTDDQPEEKPSLPPTKCSNSFASFV